MKSILLIGHNDIRLFLRGVSGYIWLFVVPIAFVYFMGFSNRGPGEPANPRPSVLVENSDKGYMGRLFLEELDTQGVQLIEPNKGTDADRAIRIPADFTEKIQKREPVKIELIRVEGSHPESAAMIEMRLTRALIGMNAHLFELAQSRNEALELPDEAEFRALLKTEDPIRLKATFAGRNPIPSGFAHSLPGNIVMFLMMNLLIFGGASISSERQVGLIKRFAVHPLTKSELVWGKLYGRLLLGFVQIAFFLLAGKFLFHINVGDQFAGIVVTLGIYAWLAAALGVLIGAVTHNPDQTVGVCVLTSILMAALGGCWWPLEVVPENMQKLGHLFPSAWAMDALHRLISFGDGFASIGVELLVLVAFALCATIAAGKLFRV
ncbi:MAG: ABC transporter permease [Verrucomicrobia bacterium]|nr:ABC transporter permease [Verrucomicrobiota bacterium]